MHFETPDNTGNEARGVLGSALLERRSSFGALALALSLRLRTIRHGMRRCQQICATAAPSISVASALNSLRGASFFAGEATNASPVTITPVTTRGISACGRLHRREIEVPRGFFGHSQEARVGRKKKRVQFSGEPVHRPLDAKPFRGPLPIVMVSRFGADHDIAGAEVG